MSNGTTLVDMSSLAISNHGPYGAAAAAIAAAVSIASLPPATHLWELGGVQTELVFGVNWALQELQDVDVDESLSMSLEDAARRGGRASSRLPDDLMDIDF